MGFMRRGRSSGSVAGALAPRAADKVRASVGQIPGCEPICSCLPRREGKVAGIVESIKLVPRSEMIRLEITISDGTGEMSGVWFGHHMVAGLDLGERVVFEGMVGSPGAGKLEILHPTYLLLGPHN